MHKRFLLLGLCAAQTLFGGWVAYVVDQSTSRIFPIDLDSDTTEPPISLASDSAPSPIAITPDRTLAYVGCVSGSNKVVPIDLVHNTMLTPIDVGGTPVALAISPDGKYVYACIVDLNELVPINISQQSVEAPISLGASPNGIAILPNGNFALVLDGSENIEKVDLVHKTVVNTLAIGTSLFWIACTPNGQKAYVTNPGEGSVTVLDLEHFTVLHTLTLGTSPYQLSISPDGTTVYVTDINMGTITPITTLTDVVGTPISVSSNPFGIMCTPDGKKAYVGDSVSGVVTPVNVLTQTALPAISVGSSAYGIACTPDQAPTARFTETLASRGEICTFNASTSSSPLGAIASYSWNFGDGTQTTTTSPTIAHTYSSQGSRTVTLIVTNSSGTSIDQTFTGQTVSNNGGPTAETSQTFYIYPPPARPSKFTGKVENRSKKYHFSLHTRWRSSPTQNVSRYEIFRHHQFLYAISPQAPFKQHIHFFMHVRDKEEFTHRLLHKLDDRYRIRIVNTTGETSSFRAITVKK